MNTNWKNLSLNPPPESCSMCVKDQTKNITYCAYYHSNDDSIHIKMDGRNLYLKRTDVRVMNLLYINLNEIK